MLDLSNYIKHEFIKNEFVKSHITISNIEEAKLMASRVQLGGRYNLIFECSYLKNYFLTILKQYNASVSIINCESSGDRLNEDIENLLLKNPHICVYDHINNCKDKRILESIKKNSASILIC